MFVIQCFEKDGYVFIMKKKEVGKVILELIGNSLLLGYVVVYEFFEVSVFFWQYILVNNKKINFIYFQLFYQIDKIRDVQN